MCVCVCVCVRQREREREREIEREKEREIVRQAVINSTSETLILYFSGTQKGRGPFVFENNN